ncbi:MAG TPA: hypothetical protein VIV11_10275 [Kofleriaceae bacterium]
MITMSPADQLSLVAVLMMASIHIMAVPLEHGLLDRPRWISIANGLSVAYVVVHLLPELAEMQREWIEAWPDRPFRWLDRQVYYAALIGLLLALGLDRLSSRTTTPGPRFWIHTISFAVYNVIIGGFALHIKRPSLLILAMCAFGAHFLVTDHGLNRLDGRAYARYGRWMLAGAIVLGWLTAIATKPHVVVVAALTGLLSGGILLDVMKEEIPKKYEGHFPAFVGSALGYSLLLLLTRYSEVLG